MRVLLQRVSSASIVVDKLTIASIGRGLLLLAGFGVGDSTCVVAPLAEKICTLRVFEDDRGRLQHSVNDFGGDLLAVPQFTLYGDIRRGRRPDFSGALAADQAWMLFAGFIEELNARAVGRVASGRFGAHMSVHLVNDGPVTLMLESDIGSQGSEGHQVSGL